jgi:thiamine biosynthesis lipoprotein
MKYDEFRAMNSDIVLAAEGTDEAAAEAFAAARETLRDGEARLTRFTTESELAQLNLSAGEWFPASPVLFAIVSEACRLFRQTRGLFDPTVLAALENVGYDRSMDILRRKGAAYPPMDRPPADNRFAEVELDPVGLRIRLPVNTRLDLGGIAKGWLAEQAAERMASSCEACAVNAGGDLFTIGRPSDGDGWSVGIEDPCDERRLLAVLEAPPGAIATSSTWKRRWTQAGMPRHHLIDPRTGWPAQTVWVSVTAIAPHAATAEAMAKALLIAGPQEALTLVEGCPDLTFIAVDLEGQLFGSSRAQEMLRVGMDSI